MKKVALAFVIGLSITMALAHQQLNSQDQGQASNAELGRVALESRIQKLEKELKQLTQKFREYR